jgi:acetone carboxylase gamma subunit
MLIIILLVLLILCIIALILCILRCRKISPPEPIAGPLLGIAYIGGVNALQNINPITGALTSVSGFPGYTGVPQGISALDSANHRYIFPMADHLFVVDTQTGAVIANPTFTESFSSFEFDQTTSTLFGIAYIGGVNTLQTIDPVTGALTAVGSFPGYIGIPQGISALDSANHHYIFPMADHLFVVDTQTGAVIANPTFTESFSSFEFDQTTGTLFGIAYIGGVNTLQSIDPATGTLTSVGSFPGYTGIPQGISALDSTNHQYIFPLADHLFVVDTQTGAVIANPTFTESFSSMEFG